MAPTSEVSNKVSVLDTGGSHSNSVDKGSCDGVSVAGGIDGASESIVWTVAASSGLVVGGEFWSGYTGKQE